MSHHENLKSIEDRLASLERQNRWQRISGVALALCLFGTVAIGQAPPGKPKIIEAEQFIVRDKEGRLRAKLATSHYGTVLSFHEADLSPGVIESKLMELGVLGGEQSVILGMHDNKTHAGINLRVTPTTGSTVLSLTSDDNKKQVSLLSSRDLGGPSLVLRNTTGAIQVTLDAASYQPFLELKTSDGKKVLRLQPD